MNCAAPVYWGILSYKIFVFVCGLFLVCKFVPYVHLCQQTLSVVIRAEAETCLLKFKLIMKINLLMLHLSLMIVTILVHTKVQTHQQTMLLKLAASIIGLNERYTAQFTL